MYTLERKERTFIIHLFFTTILGGIIGILNYAFNILIARYTSPSEIFGTYSASLGIIYLTQITGVAIQSIVTKTVARNKKNDLERYKWYSLLNFSILGVIIAIIFFFSKATIVELSSLPENLIMYLAISILLAFISPISKGLLLGTERIIFVNLLLLAETVLKFIIGIIAIKMGGNLPLLIMANSIPPVLTTIVILPLFKFKKRSKVEVRIDWKEFILMTIAFLLLTMPFTIDLVLVNKVFRPEYSSISLLGKLIYFACVTTSGVMFARLSNETDAKSQKKSLLLVITLSCVIGLVLSLLYFFFGEFIVKISIGIQYIEIVRYLGVFGLCMMGYSVVYMVANYFISRSTYSYIFILLASAILQVVLFTVRNDTLMQVIQNQVILYSLLTLGTVVFLLIKFYKDKNGREEKNTQTEDR